MTTKQARNSSLFPLPTPPESVSDNDVDSDPSPSPEARMSPTSSPWLKSAGRPPHRPPKIQLLTTPATGYEVLPPAPSPSPSASPAPLAHATHLARGYRQRRRRWEGFLESEPFWLFLYFMFNLGLTLYNKLVLVRFPFPYTLTALHAFAGTLGSYAAMELGYFTPARLAKREVFVLTMFSFLYTINIAVSNLSLQLVTVPFHQVIRAATPIFIIILSPFLLHRPLPRLPTLLSLLPVIAGVALATYGDYYFTVPGLLLTLLGTILAALKTIATNALQTAPAPAPAPLAAHHAHSLSNPPSPTAKARMPFPLPALSRIPLLSRLARASTSLPTPNPRLTHTYLGRWRLPRLHPLDLLLRMSPLAFIQCVFYAHLSGELERVRAWSAGAVGVAMAGTSAVPGGSALPAAAAGAAFSAGVIPGEGMDGRKALALAVNGAMAFGLNVVSFTANSKVGPLSITVAANIKQVLTILLSVSLFQLTITPPNAAGIVLTLVGGAWYAGVQMREKRRGK